MIGKNSQRVISLIAVITLSGCTLFSGVFTGPDDIKIVDPARAISDARRLIIEQRTKPDQDKMLRSPEELPESLRLPSLRFALIHEDHVDLVLARNPDWNVGARIWSLDSKRNHEDQPTKYPEVFFYRYYNDDPESPQNIR